MTYEKAPQAPRRAAQTIRWVVLGAVLVFVTALGVLHQTMGAGKPVGVDALCPFGGLETLGTLLTGGFLVRRIALSSLLLFGVTLVTALVFRRAFCGRICPLGFLQELPERLGRLAFKRRRPVPGVLDRPARYLKYVVLAIILYFTWRTGELVIRPYDPWAAYQHLSTPELLTEFGIGFGVLLVVLIGSFFFDRFLCTYACPMGAFLGLISKVSLFKVRRSAETCIDCGRCDRSCPSGLAVSTAETVDHADCLDCGECVAACPVADTLAVTTRRGTRLTPIASATLPVVLFAALVGLATATGAFAWTQPTLAERVSGAERGLPGIDLPEGRPGGSAGSTVTGPDGRAFDTSLIKGSTTLNEIIEVTGIPAGVFERVYGIPSSETDLQLKSLKDRYGTSPGEIRGFVAAYLADPSIIEGYVPGQSHDESDEH